VAHLVSSFVVSAFVSALLDISVSILLVFAILNISVSILLLLLFHVQDVADSIYSVEDRRSLTLLEFAFFNLHVEEVSNVHDSLKGSSMASCGMVSHDGVNYVLNLSLRVASDGRHLRFDLLNSFIELLFGVVDALGRAMA